MSRLCVLTALTTLGVVLAASPWCFAESITLTSSGGGVYDYALVVAPDGTFFAHNATITLSGLSGVTGASVLPSTTLSQAFTVSSFTPSSAVFAANVQPVGIAFPGPAIDGTLVVDSSVLTLGPLTSAFKPVITARRKARLVQFPFLNLLASCCSGQACSSWSA